MADLTEFQPMPDDPDDAWAARQAAIKRVLERSHQGREN
jgi:hypothetical protein